MTITREQARAAFNAVLAVAETIREAREIPSGTMYAALMERVDYAGYEKLISILKGAGLVEETPAHMLRWVGPEMA